MKKTFYTEIAYVLGILLLAIGNAFMERASFGISMVIAPAYILHLKISQYLSFFSFGMAGYCLQVLILLAIIIITRKFKITYLFSFLTAVLGGFALDGAVFLLSFINVEGLAVRVLFYVISLPISTMGISLLLRPYISPEAYDVFVKEVSAHFGISFGKFKTSYDLASLLISLILTLLFFGELRGIGVGTLVCAVLNGFLISRMTKLCNKFFVFRDAFDIRKRFE